MSTSAGRNQSPRVALRASMHLLPREELVSPLGCTLKVGENVQAGGRRAVC